MLCTTFSLVDACCILIYLSPTSQNHLRDLISIRLFPLCLVHILCHRGIFVEKHPDHNNTILLTSPPISQISPSPHASKQEKRNPFLDDLLNVFKCVVTTVTWVFWHCWHLCLHLWISMIKSSKSNSQWLTTSCLRCVVVSHYSTTLFALPEHQRCLLDVRKGNSSIFRPPHSLSEARPPQDPWRNFQHGSCEAFVFSLESQWRHKNLRKIWDHWNLYAHLASNKRVGFFLALL